MSPSLLSFAYLKLVKFKSFCFLLGALLLSTAIATVVTIAEILKNNELAVEKSEIQRPFKPRHFYFVLLYVILFL